MNVLIGFERSGIVRSAFQKLGCNAISCDLERSDIINDPLHRRCDIYNILTRKIWDLVIVHPVCTALAISGNAHYAFGKPNHKKRLDAIKYTTKLWQDVKKYSRHAAMENPVGVLGITPSQTIQPFDFGEDASKKTCLWLSNLPALTPTKKIDGRIIDGVERYSNQTDSGQNKLGPSMDRAYKRAKTYQGIASAMAEQWTPVLSK